MQRPWGWGEVGEGGHLRSRGKEEKGTGSMVMIKNLDVILSQKEGTERRFLWKLQIGVRCLLPDSKSS